MENIMGNEEVIPEIKVTSAGDWAKKTLDVRLVTLPSGSIFRVKNVDLQSMVSRGFLPMGLVGEFTSLADKVKQNVDGGKTELNEIGDKELKSLDTTCRKFAIMAVIEPRLSDTDPTSEDVISVNDLGFADVLFIFSSCVKGGAGNYAPFFQRGQPGIAPASDGGDIRPKTVRHRGNTGGNRKV